MGKRVPSPLGTAQEALDRIASRIRSPARRAPRDVSRYRTQFEFRKRARNEDPWVPAKRGIHDRIPAARTRERRRGDQLIDHRSPGTLRVEAGRQEYAIGAYRGVGRESDLETIVRRGKLSDFSFMPLNSIASDRPAQCTPDVGRYRTGVSSICDHGSSLLEIQFSAEYFRVLPTEPAGIAVELVLAKRMP